MTLKWLLFQEIAKIAQRLGAKPPVPFHNAVELYQFSQHAAEFQHFLNGIILTFGSNPFAKSLLQLYGFI